MLSQHTHTGTRTHTLTHIYTYSRTHILSHMMEGVGGEKRRRERKSLSVQLETRSVMQVCEILASVRVV